MKVLIIGTPRSGTSSLIRAIAFSANYKRYGEPWNKYLDGPRLPFPYNFDDNTVVKTLVASVPPQYEDRPYLEFYDALITQFDKIVLLGRKDIEEIIISYTYQMEEEKKYNGNRAKAQWHKPYKIKTNTLPIEKYRQEIETYCELLLKISQNFNLPITWYEDLYSGDEEYINKFIQQLNIDLDRKIFHKWVNPNKRLRRNTTNLI